MGQKNIAIINDMTGFGRCSLTVQIPIISALKIQPVIIPSSILSCHMQFPHYFIDDYTSKMNDYIQTYKDNQLQFDGIISGYLGNSKQVDIVIDFIQHFKNKETLVFVDPVMGDHGHLYSTIDKDMIKRMRELITYANIITPKVTELYALANEPHPSTDIDIEDINILCQKLWQKSLFIKELCVLCLESKRPWTATMPPLMYPTPLPR